MSGAKISVLSTWGSKADKHSQEAASGKDSGRDIVGLCSRVLYCAMFFITVVGELLAKVEKYTGIYLQGG